MLLLSPLEFILNLFQHIPELTEKKTTELDELQLTIQNLSFHIWSWLVSQLDFSNKQINKIS